MTLEKAVQLIQQDLDDPGSVDILDLNQAHRLALKALQAIRTGREDYYEAGGHLLPGETEGRPDDQT